MVYQRVSKFYPRNSQIHKQDSASTVPQIPVQAKSDSASPPEQEMPIYRPLAADWVTNNNLMKNLSGVAPIQAKLTIGEVGDKYEQEADTIARQVVSQINAPASFHSSPGQSLQREEMPEDEELQMKPVSGILQREEMPEDEELQMKPMMVQRKSNAGGMTATPDLEASIQQAKGGGQAIADSIREPMEKAFGADFSGVNIHTDAQSDQMNQSIQAKAFTTGKDIFFRQGAYDPGSRGGQELIAHELTHVVQQNGGAVQQNRIQRFEYNPFVTKRSLTEDLSYKDVNITEEQASPLEKIGISADMFMQHYSNGISVEDMVQIAKFALKQFPKGGVSAFEVVKYLFKAKLFLGSRQKFTYKNLSLLYQLWNELKIEATEKLVNLVVQCAADNPLRMVLYTLLKKGVALNIISIELLKQLKHLKKIEIIADMLMQHYSNGISVENMVQIAEFALKQYPDDRQDALKVANYLVSAKLCLGSGEQLTNQDFFQIAEFALKKDPTAGNTAFEITKYLFKAKLLLGSGQQFTNSNLSLLYSLWNELKIEATQELVNLVVQCAEDNPVHELLYALLKENVPLNTISIELLNHLKPFSNKLLSDNQALLRAYNVATENPDNLAKLEEWGFDRANYEAAQSHAEAVKKKHLKEGETKIEQSEKTKQDKALKDKLEDAKKELFPKEKDRQKAFPAQEPWLELDKQKYAKNQKSLKTKQKELAAEDFKKFAQEREVEESNLNIGAEKLSTQDQDKYKRYLADISYDKEAPKVLNFAKDNFDDATKIGLAMQQVPDIINVIKGPKLSASELINCIDTLGVVNLGTLLGRISYASLQEFAGKQERLKLLLQLQTHNINVSIIQGVGSQFGTFNQYCDSGSITHFSNLLQNYTIDEIKNLLTASQQAIETDKRMAFLARIMPYANSANNMVKFLNLAKTVSEKCSSYNQLAGLWKAAKIELALNNQPLGMNENELKQLLVSDVLTSINKQNHFSVWIDILNILIQENLVAINKEGGNHWYSLPHRHPYETNNTYDTYEIKYEVKTKDGNTVLETFVAHWHPKAVSADTKNPNASKKHLKPVPGDTQTQRVYENSVPKPLAENLLWGTH